MRLLQITGCAVFAVTLAGCSVEGIKRLGFDESQQYACKEANEGRPNESMNDLKCMSATEREGMSYEEYQQARSQQSR